MRVLSPLLCAASIMTTGSALAVPSAGSGNRNLQVTVDFNFITHDPNTWVSSGAFVDAGTIGHGTDERFQGGTAVVTDSPEGADGSFTWSFRKVYTSNGTSPVHLTRGEWTMLGGTGEYEGISGRGTISGWWNDQTGEIHDEFVGTVDCPNCE